MLARFPIGGAIVLSLCCRSAWELEDHSAFRRGAFQVFMLAVKSEELSLVPGESRRDILGVGGQLLFVNCLFSRKYQVGAHGSLGVRAAVDGKVRTGNVGGFRTCNERDQGCHFVHSPIAAKHCVGLLRCYPIARGGI